MTLLNLMIILITLPLVGILLLGAFRFYQEGSNELDTVSATKRPVMNENR